MAKFSIDLSGKAICDLCGGIHTAETSAIGGMLAGSYACCPECTPRYLEGLKRFGEEHFIRDFAREGETFFDATMRWRAGNNTITFNGPDEATVQEMASDYRKRFGSE